MKKVLSFVLCAVMILGSLCITTPAAALSVHFSSSDCVTSDGAAVSYDSYLNAVKVETDGKGATLSFDINGAEGYFAAWLPASYKMSAALTVDGSAATLPGGHKFVSVPAGETVVLPAAESAYDVYFYGVGADADEIVAAANGTLDKFEEEYLDLSEYEVERYTKYFWDNDIVFNESFFPIKEKDGSFAPITLMYDVDRVISVKNSYLNREYTYGKDYYIENGKLMLTPDTSILSYDYSTIYTDNPRDTSYRQMLNGGYAYCGQLMTFFTGYCNITYTPASQWDGIVPESKGYMLPKTMEKLKTAGSSLKILSIGDSLAGGANASISNGTLPYADIWRDMVPKALQLKYPDVEITYNTIAQGGATASLAIEKMYNILSYAPDLIFIEFGTNECMNGDSAWVNGGYIDTLVSAINSINTNLPDCEIVLVSPIISNPVFFPTDWFYAYADSLYSLEREGVIAADATSLYQYMMANKRYIDMTGDNLCHPSDFGTRLFVQTILKGLEEGSEEGYIEGLSERITNYRYENEFYPEQWSQIETIVSQGKSAVAAAQTVDEARELFLSYAAEIDAVPNITDIEKSAKIDCEKLIFNYPKVYDVVDKSEGSINNVNVRYDEDKNVLMATVSAPRKPNFFLKYSEGEKEIIADNYGYAVVTCMESLENSTRATTSTLAFKINGEELTAKSFTHIKDGKFHSYIVDLTDIEGFTGKVDGVKFGVYSTAVIGDVLEISSIILCDNYENAQDTAVERERIANNDAKSAVTYLMCDEETSSMLRDKNSAEVLLGDCNTDGKISAKDVLMLRLYLCGRDVQTDLAAADADRDGDVGATDVVKLRRLICGKDKWERVLLNNNVEVSYDSVNEAAKVVFGYAGATVKADISGAELSADMFKYVTLCAKTADMEEMNVTVTVTTENGSYSDEVVVEAGEFFTADTAKLTGASGKILTVEFAFDNAQGETVYFDSFVLTPTVSAAKNTETVRIGAANLI